MLAQLNVGIRWALYLDLMLLFGLPAFHVYAPVAARSSVERAVALKPWLISLALLGTVFSAMGLAVLCAAMADMPLMSLDRPTVMMVLNDTPVGAAWKIRMGLLALTVLLLLALRNGRTRPLLLTLLGLVELGTLAWSGHGAAGEGMSGTVALAADIAHLTAAGLWIGGLAVQVASTNIMGVVVVLVGGFAGEHSWRMPFFAYAIAIVLLVPVVLFTHEPNRGSALRAATGPATEDQGWRRLLAIRCALTFFVSVTVYTLIVQMSFLLAERGVSNPSMIGFGISFGAGGIALGSVANTFMLSVPARYRLLAAYFLMAGGFGAIALNPAFAMMCAGALAAGLGAGCAVSTLLCVTVSGVPGSLKGRAAGSWTAAMFFGQFSNPPLFVMLVRLGGSYGAAFLIYSAICGAVAVGAVAPIALARRRSRTRVRLGPRMGEVR